MNKDPIVCYVLMRNDLASLGAGKACAHAHHAGTRMVWSVNRSGSPAQFALLQKWMAEAEGVGVTIVLEADEETVKWCVSQAACLTEQGVSAGVWTDPTYPSTTARGFCLMKVDVCGWILGAKSVLEPLLGDLPLMSNQPWGPNLYELK